jgi:hypothetical protein
VADALSRAGYRVDIISPSWSIDNSSRLRYVPRRNIDIDISKKLILSPSLIGVRRKWARNIKIGISLLWLFTFLVIHTSRKEKVLAYHSPWLSLPIRMAKKIKGFHLILEVEEIYSQVWKINDTLTEWEKKSLASADTFIAVSDVLAEILGNRSKIIVYGNYYPVESARDQMQKSTIDIVYAGSFDKVKGGAQNAVQCIRYLPREYVLHVCGYGEAEETNELLKDIESINSELKRNACVYHGMKNRKELSIILQQCQIAINPQNEGGHMATAFPSKILSYLGHNLRIVSTRISSILRSEVSSLIVFSEDDKPESLAKAIRCVDLSLPFDCGESLRRLDDRFIAQLKKLFQ